MPTDPPPQTSSRPAGEGGCRQIAGILLLAALLTVVLSVFLAHRLKDMSRHLLADEFRSLAIQLAENFATTFQFTPRIVVGSETLQIQHAEKAQLVTAETNVVQSYDWSHSWAGSTKRLSIEASFVARAGFDLEKPILVEMDPETRAVRAIFPAPEIFGVEMRDLRVITDENGFWNKLTADERNQAIRELQRIAREKIESGNILARAESNAQTRLLRLLRSYGESVSFSFGVRPAPKP